jgi:hypothetical protein
MLFAWELGGGNGHLGRFFPIARSLLDFGHSLTLVVRDPVRATKLFEGLDVDILQAPLWPTSERSRIISPTNYSQVLFNVGFGEHAICRQVLTQWQSIENRVRPDLVIADHAPGILFALNHQRPAVAIGTGFSIPQTGVPMPSFALTGVRADENQTLDFAMGIETDLLQTLNRVRRELDLEELESLGEVFDRCHATFLTTFRELDHYTGRRDATYRGAIAYDGFNGENIIWPSGIGPRIFAYLKRSRGLGHLLDAIGQSGCPAIIVVDLTCDLPTNRSRCGKSLVNVISQFSMRRREPPVRCCLPESRSCRSHTTWNRQSRRTKPQSWERRLVQIKTMDWRS